MRVILHSDLNNFYASVACLENPALQRVPMAVCGEASLRHGIVLSKNELAKAAGVKTAEAIWQAREKCPNLVVVGAQFEKYLKMAQKMREIYARYSDRVEAFGLDEAWLDVSDLGLDGRAAADEIRARAKAELGLTVSVGVSFNKVFAKLGSDLKKPDATTCITRENFRAVVWPLPSRELLFVGPATQRRLAQCNIHTIGDIARCRPEILRAKLGKHGLTLWQFANGLEDSPVRPLGVEETIKSISNSVTPARDLADDADARQVLTVLAESVGERLLRHALMGRTVAISIRDCDLSVRSAQETLPQPTALATEIKRSALRLFRRHWAWEKSVRSVGICVSTLEPIAPRRQLCLFDDPRRERLWALERALVDVRGRFGHDCVCRAMLLKSDFSALHPDGERPAFARPGS